MSLIKDAKLHKEIPFIVNGELKQIDLMAEKDGIINIIDYKTGKEKHKFKLQLRGYKTAIKSFYPKKLVKSYLVYLNNSILIEEVS